MDTTWTWEELVKVEPRLAVLETDIRAVKAPERGPWSPHRVWAKQFKPRLLGLVGWHARNPTVGSTEAYELAYSHLYDLLPDYQEE